MLDLTAQHLEVVKGILGQHVPSCEIRVFGSRTNGKARSYSDLDLAIVGKEKIPLRLMCQLQEGFENSSLPFRVEILDWYRVSDEFKKVIEKNYVILDLKKF